MRGMARRRRRKRRDRTVAYRAVVGNSRVVMVILVSVAVGFAFYLALQWAAEAARGDLGAVWRTEEKPRGQ